MKTFPNICCNCGAKWLEGDHKCKSLIEELITKQIKMTTKEFEAKFKKGDKICLPFWEKDEETVDFIIVDHVYQGRVYFQHEQLEEWWFDVNDYWQQYKEPVKKDLEGLKKWYILRHKQFCIDVVYAKDKTSISTWKGLGDKLEYLTEEEAIERGVKI